MSKNKKKSDVDQEGFRFRMRTQDGSMVLNRRCSMLERSCYRHPDNSWVIKAQLEDDARQRGVRVLSYEYDAIKGIDALVEWL